MTVGEIGWSDYELQDMTLKEQQLDISRQEAEKIKRYTDSSSCSTFHSHLGVISLPVLLHLFHSYICDSYTYLNFVLLCN